jgi:hypothetical protein
MKSGRPEIFISNPHDSTEPKECAPLTLPRPPTPTQSKPDQLKAIKLFFSYSHNDEGLRRELEKHLGALKRQGVIEAWHDHNIDAGEEWKTSINENLGAADIILLLISADFLDSDYCYEIEMRRALERHERREAAVVPVILRPVDWGDAPFGKLQALPKGAKPVTTWRNQDEAFKSVADGIHRIVEKLRSVKPEIRENVWRNNSSPNRDPVRLTIGRIMIASAFAVILWAAFSSSIKPPVIETFTREDNDAAMFVTRNTSWRVLAPWSVPEPDFTPWPWVVPWKDSGWLCGNTDEVCKVTGRRIRGRQMGLFRSANTETVFNLFQDFLLHLNLRLINGARIAWVVRAKNFENYYLFELILDRSGNRKHQLHFKRCLNGKLETVIPVNVVEDIGEPCRQLDIYTQVTGGTFRVFIRPEKPDPKEEPINDRDFDKPVSLGIFQDKALSYGGVGFYSDQEMDLQLHQLRAMPWGTEDFNAVERSFPHE